MQRKTVAGLAVIVVLAGFAAYWFGIRDRGGDKPKAVATEADPWAKPPSKEPKPERASGEPGAGGAMPRLAHETDPLGTFVLEGQVLDEQDQAVAGALVRISASPTRTATTNATGEFRFDKLLGRSYALTARKGDKLGGPVTAKGSSREPVVIRLRQGATLEVAVTDAAGKKPVVGAKVMLLDDDEAEDQTGADGVARFPAVAVGWTRFAVTAAGFSPGNGVARIGQGEKLVKVDVALQKGAALSGRVVDEQRQPVADARVWPVDAANAWMSGGGDRVAVTSGKDGTFT
ncbi:MAG: carboxypeptidase-like regulatory domain-containing protein, partial [Rhodoglobus sp.]